MECPNECRFNTKLGDTKVGDIPKAPCEKCRKVISDRMRAKLKVKRNERISGVAANCRQENFSTISKNQAKDKGFRQQKEFGPKMRRKP